MISTRTTTSPSLPRNWPGAKSITISVCSEEAPGLSVFAKDSAGKVYHTYSTYGRGLEQLIGAYTLLDLVPKGRDEDPEATMNWVRYHDRYEHGTAKA
jgi:predicted dithiol-disulfide oxidoreductase (DUF899 family)